MFILLHFLASFIQLIWFMPLTKYNSQSSLGHFWFESVSYLFLAPQKWNNTLFYEFATLLKNCRTFIRIHYQQDLWKRIFFLSFDARMEKIEHRKTVGRFHSILKCSKSKVPFRQISYSVCRAIIAVDALIIWSRLGNETHTTLQWITVHHLPFDERDATHTHTHTNCELLNYLEIILRTSALSTEWFSLLSSQHSLCMFV